MNEITADTHIDELLVEYPSLSKTFIEFGMPCLVCGEPFWGTIAEMSKQHRTDIEKLVNQLNQRKAQIDAKS
ncbi:DUF1858 domain-containing protein [candidate division WOR-3 bacterium]|nr:DUF1858 domain-containing protein [candidate division WOR-3 bacterium]